MSPINHFILVIKKMHRQDIEWARDGDDGKLYIVQARPETVASQKKVGVIEEYKMLEKGTLDDLEYGKQLECSTKKDEWMGYLMALQQIYRYTYTEVVALFVFFWGGQTHKWDQVDGKLMRTCTEKCISHTKHMVIHVCNCVLYCNYYVLFVQFSVLLIV